MKVLSLGRSPIEIRRKSEYNRGMDDFRSYKTARISSNGVEKELSKEIRQ